MNQAPKDYRPEKLIWSEKDFDQMGWHDNVIYAIAPIKDFQLAFDIDYIFNWVLVGDLYNFWVSPCTLIFDNVLDITFESSFHNSQWEIDNIIKGNPRKPFNYDDVLKEQWDYNIELHDGSFSFKSVGYNQFVRSPPALIETQSIGIEKREGISFSAL